MKQLKEKMKSIRVKLFVTLCMAVVIIIVFLVLANNIILETFYLYFKKQNLISVYNTINEYYNNINSNIDIELELEKIAENNNFDILIKNNNNISIYSTNKDFLSTINKIHTIRSFFFKENEDILYNNDNKIIRKVEDSRKWINIYIIHISSEQWIHSIY